MRKPWLWEEVSKVFRFPKTDEDLNICCEKQKVLPPMRDKFRSNSVVRTYTKEVLVQWGAL
jgi:hypothetical protein